MSETEQIRYKGIIKYIICSILAFVPGSVVWYVWSENLLFIHEVGHTYFSFFDGASSVWIFSNPPSVMLDVPESFIGKILVSLGGIIFALIFTLFTILLITLYFSYKHWQMEIALHYGYKTLAFQISLAMGGFLFTEFFNLIPIESASDMSLLLEYLDITIVPEFPKEVLLIGPMISILVLISCIHSFGNMIYCAYLSTKS